MPKYIFAYHGGGMPETPEEGERVMAAWQAWFADMGEAVVVPGAPVGPYPHHHPCTATIGGVTLERLTEPDAEVAARIAAGEFRAGLSTQ